MNLRRVNCKLKTTFCNFLCSILQSRFKAYGFSSLLYEYANMDRHEKCFLAHFLLFLYILPSGNQNGFGVNSQVLHSATLKDAASRQSKQYQLPIVWWPIPARLLVPNEIPMVQLHPHMVSNRVSYAVPQIPFLVNQHPDSNYHENLLSHASKVGAQRFPRVCKTRDNKSGNCKPFTECFPMISIQYGNDSDIQNDQYEDSPLVQQLFSSTNSTTCKDETALVQNVCCSNEYSLYRSLNNVITNDEDVLMPSITQRPPRRKLFYRYLNIPIVTCGQSKQKNWNLKNGLGQNQPKITGGQEARGPLEFPWMVAVFGQNKKIFCGASLISNQFLLSAAHCFSTFTAKDVPNLYVHLGDFNLKTTTDGSHEVRKIDKIIINKGFKIENYHNDIALVRLDRPVNFTDRIQPICLPEPEMDTFEKKNLVVTGWGRKYRYGLTSDVLRKVEIPVWNLKECSRIYSTFAPGRIQDNNICAGDGKRNKDACLGDSGGPAIYFNGEKWVQLGITSWGKGCGSFPGVYTRVDKHLMWITKNLNLFA